MKSTKKMILTTLVGVLALSSIGFSAAGARSSRKASNLSRKFSCSSRDVTVQNLSTDRVRLTDGNGKVYNLKLTRSGSGEEYTGGGVSIHIKGNDAVFTRNGSDESCYMTGNGNSSSNQSSSNNLLRKYSCDGYQDITVENVSTDKVKVADGYGGIHTLSSAASVVEKDIQMEVFLSIWKEMKLFTQKTEETKAAVFKILGMVQLKNKA